MKHKLKLVGYVLATTLFFLALFYSSIMQYVDYRVLDSFNKRSPSIHVPKSIIVINIDDKSLQQVGQWPWPRVITAKLIDTISQNKPKAITLDMVFSEKDKTSPVVIQDFYSSLFEKNITLNGLPKELQDNDALLAEVINKSHVILPLFSNSHSQSYACLLPDKILNTQDTKDMNLSNIDSLVCSLPQFKPHGIGHIHAKADSDGILRSLSMVTRYDDMLIPGFGLATVANSKINLTKPASPFFGDMQINFDNKHINTGQDARVLLMPYSLNKYKTISAVDILNEDFDAKDIEDKYVLIGTNALGLDSTYILSDGSVRSGVCIYATMIENILNGDTRVMPSFYKLLNLILAFTIGLLLLYQMINKKYLKVVYIYVASILIAVTIAYIAWEQYHIYISIGYFIGLLSCYIFILSLLMFVVDYYKDKRFIDEINYLESRKKIFHMALEKSIEKRNSQKALIVQQSKMVVVGEMLDFIAHQWSQPLNIVSMQIQNAQLSWEKGQVDDDYVSKLVDDIQTQVEYMAQTIVDFRNFVKPNEQNIYFGVHNTINEALHLLAGLFEPKGIVVDIKRQNKSLTIYGPEGAFKQVIVSILKNAYDIISDRKIVNPKIQIKISKAKEKTIITIQDNAGGVAKNIIDRIFDPMFTTKDQSKGTGVGLYISRAIIENKFKGSISVSNVEDGAMFTIII